MPTTDRSGKEYVVGAFLVAGAGIGIILGSLLGGGAGIALGAALGAAAGVITGSVARLLIGER